MIRNCFSLVSFGHPGYELENEVADVIFTENHPEGKRKTMTEGPGGLGINESSVVKTRKVFYTLS